MLSVRVPSCEMLCGRRAECPAAQIRPTEQTSSLIVPSAHPHRASGIEREGARKGQTWVYSG